MAQGRIIETATEKTTGRSYYYLTRRAYGRLEITCDIAKKQAWWPSLPAAKAAAIENGRICWKGQITTVSE